MQTKYNSSQTNVQYFGLEVERCRFDLVDKFHVALTTVQPNLRYTGDSDTLLFDGSICRPAAETA
jgi:hypothetical protein